MAERKVYSIEKRFVTMQCSDPLFTCAASNTLKAPRKQLEVEEKLGETSTKSLNARNKSDQRFKTLLAFDDSSDDVNTTETCRSLQKLALLNQDLLAYKSSAIFDSAGKLNSAVSATKKFPQFFPQDSELKKSGNFYVSVQEIECEEDCLYTAISDFVVDIPRERRNTKSDIFELKIPDAFQVKSDEGKSVLFVTLPDFRFISVEVTNGLILDDVLEFLCSSQNLSYEDHTFQLYDQKKEENGLPSSSFVSLELDNKVEYLVTELRTNELFLVEGKKEYRSNVVTQNGNPVLVFQRTSGRFCAMAGTPLELMVLLTAPEQNDDPYFVDTFLLTFRSFITPIEVLCHLLGQYFCELIEQPAAADIEYFERIKEPLQIKVLLTLLRWVGNYWHDFIINTELRAMLDDFIFDVCNIESNDICKTYGMQLQQLANHQTDKYSEIQEIYRNVSRRGKAMESMFMDIKPSVLGQQLCLYCFSLFRNIHAIEYLDQIWSGKKEDTPFLSYFIERFDKESYWVATEILSERNLKRRIQILKNVILATEASVSHNNFFSLFSFISGLNLSPVSRLKKTWGGLPDPIKSIYQKIEKLADPSRNMKNYRDLLATVAPPIVPFLPIYLKDLTFMNDGNEKFIDGMINFERLRMMGCRVKEIVSLAEVNYSFSPDPAIQNFIAMPLVETSLAKLKEMSCLCEK
ncbi:Ras protein-specific guanine nucleotide-releasing factor [Entophlyctis luteolus]|nr:Ras protein-specific guanine nucleotide-releasing factor [Entophlyctis luteolus]